MLQSRSLVVIFSLILGVLSVQRNQILNEPGFHRQKKLFSLFNVVQFQNGPCSTTSEPGTTGTCLSRQECNAQNGMPDGNCASGFGVCCVFILTACNGIVNKNCTAVRNMGFPGSDPNNGRTCMITLNRLPEDICQIRLDFQAPTVLPLGNVQGMCGGTGDILTVTSPHSTFANAFPPAICGTLTGQHMYFESGRTGNMAGQINILQGTGANDRRYNIKVTYIECNSLVRAPSGCAQFFTGLTGTIMSYNFPGGQLLVDQVYGNCIRQNEGFCSVQYSESQIVAPDPFELSGTGMKVQDNCMTENHITIPSNVLKVIDSVGQVDSVTVVPSMRCNNVFGSVPFGTTPGSLVSTPNLPFVVNVRTNPFNAGVPNIFSGFSLDYAQVPC